MKEKDKTSPEIFSPCIPVIIIPVRVYQMEMMSTPIILGVSKGSGAE